MAAWQAVAAFAILIVIVLIVWYLSNGFALPHQLTSTIPTTIPGANQVINGTTTSTIIYTEDCEAFSLYTGSANTTVDSGCTWTGGPLGLWVASGNSTYEKISIVGADNLTYVNQTASYQCTSFFENFTAPAQRYTVTLTTGPRSNDTNPSCPRAFAIINQTLSPSKTEVYSGSIYNGNFSNGAYTGWNVSGPGFGKAPINITRANSPGNITCYEGVPWTNYAGAYFATTYTCGTSVSPGNLTSSSFYASKSFLNFKIISPQNNFIYVEVLYNNTPYIIAHYDTYNITLGANAQSTFRNASIPLVTVVDKPIQIRVVADTQISENYVAIGDFTLANKPVQDKGIMNGPYQFTT
jgi:hypothetical protein